MQDLEIKIRTTAETAGADQAAQAIGKVDTATKQAAAGTASAGKAAKGATADLRELAQAGQGANQAIAGFSQGGLAGAVMGLRGMAAAIKGLLGSGLGLLLIPLGLIAGALYAIGKAADNAREKMMGTGERTKATAEAMKRLGEASEQNIKKAAADANRLADAYNRVSDAIDGALSRFKQVESARAEAEVSGLELQRQQALAKAGTEEERSRINASFDTKVSSAKGKSAAAITDKEFFAATQTLTESMTTRRKAQGEIDAATGKVTAARAAEAKARASGNVDAFGNALRAREAAEKELGVVTERNQPILDKANRDYADTDARISALGYQQTTQRNTQQIGTVTASNPMAQIASRAKVAAPEIESRYEALAERLRGSNETGETNRLAAELDKVNAERQAAYRAIGEFAEGERKARADLERDLQANRERSGGG